MGQEVLVTRPRESHRGFSILIKQSNPFFSSFGEPRDSRRAGSHPVQD